MKWDYEIPPKNTEQWLRMLITFLALFWCSMQFMREMAFITAAVIFLMDCGAFWWNARLWRTQVELRKAVFDATRVVIDTARAQALAEWNLHRAYAELRAHDIPFTLDLDIPEPPKPEHVQ